MLAERGYDSDKIIHEASDTGMTVVILNKAGKPQAHQSAPAVFQLYIASSAARLNADLWYIISN